VSVGLVEISLPHKLAIAIVSVGAFLAAAVALTPVSGQPFLAFLLIPVGGLFLAIFAAQITPLWAQLFARAMQWSNLGLGLALSLFGSRSEANRGLVLALACGAALLTMGGRGLLQAQRGAMPAALRGALLLLMVLALADAESFAVFGFAGVSDANALFGGLLLFAAFALLVGFVLLARLSLLGVIVNGVACLVVLVDCAQYTSKDTLRAVLVTLAVVHLAVVIPTLLAASRGRDLVTLRPRTRAILANGLVVALMLAAIVPCALR